MATINTPWSNPQQRAQEAQPQAPAAGVVLQQPVSAPKFTNRSMAQPPAPAINVTPRRMVLLLPLSGPHAALGNNLLMAAQMAVQDLAPANFTVAPYDTALGAAPALQRGLNEKTDIIVGPLFSADVAATKAMAAAAGVPMLALSNDQAQADRNTYLMGSWPGEQIQRVTSFAVQKGARRFLAILPDNAYGQTLKNSLPAMLDQPAQLVDMISYKPAGFDAMAVAQQAAAQRQAIDVIILPEGAPNGVQIAAALAQAGALQNDRGRIRLLGSSLWDEAVDNNALSNGWYATQDPVARVQFTNRYQRVFATPPPAIASLAYDATALAAVLASRNWPYTPDMLTQAQGFAGMGGIFRLTPNGMVQRALSVQEVLPSGQRMADPAPNQF